MMRKPFLILLALLCFVFPAAMAEGQTYTNPETGYLAVLEDDIDLLTEQEEASLMETMKTLTEHTNVAFWSTKTALSQSGAIQDAENKHIRLFGSHVNGIVFMIDMKVRYMFLDTEGWIQDVIPKSTAEIITNNVRSSMSAGQYFQASEKVFEQVLAKINGERITEPMRYLSAAAIGMMCGLLIALFLTVSRRNRMNPMYSRAAVAATVVSLITANSFAGDMKLQGEPTVTRTYSPPARDSSSSCSSCSSCSGGSSCSSCSGGSSCGGGSSF